MGAVKAARGRGDTARLTSAKSIVCDGVYDTPPRSFFQARLLDSQEGASTERYVFSSSRRHLSNADVFGTGTIPTIPTIPTINTVEISTMENRPRGVWYTPSYTGTYRYGCIISHRGMGAMVGLTSDQCLPLLSDTCHLPLGRVISDYLRESPWNARREIPLVLTLVLAFSFGWSRGTYRTQILVRDLRSRSHYSIKKSGTAIVVVSKQRPSPRSYYY